MTDWRLWLIRFCDRVSRWYADYQHRTERCAVCHKDVSGRGIQSEIYGVLCRSCCQLRQS